MNSLGDSFAYPFRSPGWFGKMLLQGLIVLIPIIGWIAMTGWLMMAFENARAGRRELPPAGFHLARGIEIFLVFFIYGFVLTIPTLVLSVAGGIFSGVSSSHGANVGSPLAGLGFLYSFLAGLFLQFLVPSLIVNTHTRGLAGGLDVARVWRLTQINLTNSVSAGVVVWVTSIIGGLGFAICFFGIILTIPMENAIKAGAAAWLEKVQVQQPSSSMRAAPGSVDGFSSRPIVLRIPLPDAPANLAVVRPDLAWLVDRRDAQRDAWIGRLDSSHEVGGEGGNAAPPGQL